MMGLRKGSKGTKQTLQLMRRLVRASKKNLIIRSTALELTRQLDQKDWRGEILAVFHFVRDRIRYVRDVRQIETLHDPQRVLKQGQGDCDDKSVLLASMLESIGHPTRFVAVGFRPDKFSHVYVETKLGNRWLPLDATEPRLPGWSPPNIVSKLIVTNSNS